MIRRRLIHSPRLPLPCLSSVTKNLSSNFLQNGCSKSIRPDDDVNPALERLRNGSKMAAQFRAVKLKLRPTSATIAFSLPTKKPDRVSSDAKIPKPQKKCQISTTIVDALKAYAMSELEARKIRKPNTGTEALLMWILIEGTNTAAKFLRANGITLEKVREETFNLVGKPNKYFFSPEHPLLIEAAQRVVDRAFEEKLNSGRGRRGR